MPDDEVVDDLASEVGDDLGANTTDPLDQARLSGDLVPAAAPRQCFVCDLDPSISACSSIPSNAQHRCNRACIECVNGACFVGTCEPL